jgi:EcoRII C terminal.
MQRGFLSQYFEGIAIKRLSAVEVNTSVSNQHEFNGSKPLRNLFGDERRTSCNARFLWLGGENEGISSDGKITWYDARERHPTRSEYRLYFNRNEVMNLAMENDLLIVAKRPNDEFFIIVVRSDSTLENQLLWLFGFDEQIGFNFNFQSIENGHNPEVDYAIRYILEELGIEIEEPDVDVLDSILEPYIISGQFPTTSEFSKLARKTLPGVSAVDDPDLALMKWMEHEEKLFKRLERHIISKKLELGFRSEESVDVEGFLQFSLSVHNRRKSRVGYALENHLEEVFKVHQITYSRTAITENKSRPDFLFPGIGYYHNPSFPSARLTMLGVKSTCKDRWRQVLAEANRIKTKHLLTLEPGISENQTDEMQASNLQLVIPQQLHETYKPRQKTWLINLSDFIQIVREKQNQR